MRSASVLVASAAVAVLGCRGGVASPAATPAPVEVAVPTQAEPGASLAPPSSSVDGSPGGRPTASTSPACAAAFADQRQLYLDPEVEVHPAREAAFLRTCASMPPAFQRCASPLYQVDHESECEAVKAESGTPAARAWSRTFGALGDGEPHLPPPP